MTEFLGHGCEYFRVDKGAALKLAARTAGTRSFAKLVGPFGLPIRFSC